MNDLSTFELWRQIIVLVPLSFVLSAAAWTDFKERKVFNKLTYPAFFVGLVVHFVAFGPSLGAFGEAFGAAIMAFFIGLMLMPFGWIGGGDIKLLVAVGAFLGFGGLGQVTFYSVLVGGVFGLLNAAVTGHLWVMLKRIGRYLRSWFRVVAYQSMALKEEMEHDADSYIPFAVSVLAGGVLAYTEATFGWPPLWQIFTGPFSG